MVSSKIAIYTMLINPLTKYAVLLSPIATAIEDHFQQHSSKFTIAIIRTLSAISTVGVAVAFPFFEYLMAFIGALLSVAVSIIFPCICYLKISKRYRSFELELFVIIIILVGGSLVGVAGAYMSLKQIIMLWSMDDHTCTPT
ncbi:hypothetical protein Syun_023613 [Stephania yunnanensis]|uniref:Amino acid transporter transmembrane domain-containing protein n=1 Tax=Stephania yunnanensis TaxID=152371 RepID=A0AAP0FCR3_9MAGN